MSLRRASQTWALLSLCLAAASAQAEPVATATRQLEALLPKGCLLRRDP